MKQTMIPYSDRIVIRQIDLEHKTKGGIILSDVEKDRETIFGRVVAVGPGKQVDSQGVIPMHTKVGDIIVVGARIPVKINIKGLFYYMLNESNAFMKLVDEELVEKEFATEGYEFTAGNTKILN